MRCPTRTGLMVTGCLTVAACSSAASGPASSGPSSTSATAATSTSASAPASTSPSASASTAPTSSTSPGPTQAPPCQATDLTLGVGDPVVPKTGEHAVTYTLTNAGSSACSLEGYPTITLYDGWGAELGLRPTRSGFRYATRKPPAPVVLMPRALAYFLVAKYACDLGATATAVTVRVSLPSVTGALTAPANPSGRDVGTLSSCKGAADNPGQLFEVSPFESSQDAVFSS